MHKDFQPYYVRVGDSWTKIDYSKKPSEWMVPLKRGKETDLIEIPASWYLDDLPPMMFIKKAPNSHGFVNPRHLEEMWRDQFDWVYREYDYAVFPITIHPDVGGRPQVLLMLERLYNHMVRHPGVRFCHHGRDGGRLCPPLTATRSEAINDVRALRVVRGCRSLDGGCRQSAGLWWKANPPCRTRRARPAGSREAIFDRG